MTKARQLLVAALAAVTLVITAAPASPAPDLSDYEWQTALGTEAGALANGEIFAIEVAGDDLYLGGSFTDFAGIAAADRIVRWSGADEEWQALEPASATDGSITSGTVQAIEVSGGFVYVGGSFTFTDSSLSSRVNLAVYAFSVEGWFGFAGVTSGDAVSNGEVLSIFADEGDGLIYVGGTFIDGGDDANADFLMVGSYDICVVVVVGGCSAPPPVVTICGGGSVTISCIVYPPNLWSPAGDNGAGGPALSGFVSSISAHPDGGVIVAGNFGAAGGVTGADSIAHFTGRYASPQAWIAQSGVPSVTMFATENFEGTLYLAGWEGLYRRTGGTAWEELCAATLHISGEQWSDLAVVSDSLVFVSSQIGALYACDPATGQTTQVVVSAPVRRVAMYDGDLTVAGVIGFANLPTSYDYVARFVRPLPDTNTEGGQGTDGIIVLATLAALTALAGSQILRRA